MKIGFIGLGLMGNLMAKNILKSRFDLTVYNRTPAKTAEFKKLGVKVAPSPKELGKCANVIITMVTSGKDVQEVLFGKNGVVESGNKNLTIVDMGTIGPSFAKNIAAKLHHYNIHYIDAPVTGSTPKAKTGELTIFVGGKKEVFEKIKPVLLSMGKTLHYMGSTGSGQIIKLINNQVIATTVQAVIEGMLLADAMKLSRKRAGEVLKTVPAFSFYMNLKIPTYVDNKFPLLFSTANMKKDLELAYEEMKKGKKNLPVLIKLVSLYKKATKKGLANEDFASIIKALD
ncbi:NAD(P)-dependent oxidoreductase [Candidatus Roizmanbacteria bacterium]|nr:NAD(P)-dependent oxidoreductase [Candidatus Roizmanbacteria bacterium]